MRRASVLFMAALMPLSLLTSGAVASPPSPHMEAPALATMRADALTAALAEGSLTEAQYALHRARSLFELGEVRAEFGDVSRVAPRSVTIVLRDLSLRLAGLSGAEKAEALDILARPTKGGSNDGTLEYDTEEATPVDSPHFRIHYVTTGDHKSTLGYATAISGVMEEVWTKEITQMGWRAPKSDQSATHNGGNALFDVYLGNVGSQGYYGYCQVDAPQTTPDQHAYCVLDNDFSASEFGQVINGLTAARVTAAHEFHHAVQFAYDVTDDQWLLEATATWMEDQVYDDINDNYQYLSGGPLGRPTTPADTWTQSGANSLYQYGTFIWMRYLHEKAADPDIVRRIWEKTAEPQMYSLKAIESVLGGDAAFADSFADFAARNAKPSAFYEEGAAYEGKVPPVRTETRTVVPGTPVLGAESDADHLTSRYISFKPGSGTGATEELTIAVDMGSSPMQEARVVTIDAGAATPFDIDLVDLIDGEGTVTVPFGGVDEVVLVLTNASNQMTSCTRWRPGTFSCGGTPAHENLAYTYSAVTGKIAQDPGEPIPAQDITAPTLTGVKVKPNPVRRGSNARILFNLGEDAVVQVTILRNGRKVLSGSDQVPAGNGWYFTWEIGKKMATGKYTVKLKATDTAGNSKTAKTGVKIVK